MGQIKKKKHIGIIDSNDIEQERIRFCQNCLEFNFRQLLGPRVIMPGETKQPDHELWSQCPACGAIYGTYETKIESKIQDFTEISTNPHDQGKSMVGLGNITKGKATDFQRRKRRMKKEIDSRISKIEDKDPEIAAEIKKGNTVTIIEDY